MSEQAGLVIKVGGTSAEAVAAVEALERSINKLIGVAKASSQEAEKSAQREAAALTRVGVAARQAAIEVVDASKRKTDALDQLADRSAKLQQGFQHLAVGAVALATPLAVATKQAVDFDTQLRQVNSIAKLGPQEFEKLRASVLALSRDPNIVKGPTDLAAGLYDLYSVGIEGQDALDALRQAAIGATAGVTTTAVATDALTSVLKSGVPGVHSAKDAMDQLFQIVNLGKASFPELAGQIGTALPVAKQAGVTFQEVGAAFVVMNNAGFSAAEATTAITGIIRAVIAPSKEMTRALGEHAGILSVSNIRTVGLAGVMQQLLQVGKGNSEVLLQLGLDHRSLNAALALTADGGKQFTEALEGMKHAGDGVGQSLDANSKILEGTQAKWEKLRSELERLGITLGNDVLPRLNGILEWAAQHPKVVEMGVAIGGIAIALNQVLQAAVALKTLGFLDFLATGGLAAKGGLAGIMGRGAGAAAAAPTGPVDIYGTPIPRAPGGITPPPAGPSALAQAGRGGVFSLPAIVAAIFGYKIAEQNINRSNAEMAGNEVPELSVWINQLAKLRQQLKADPGNPKLLERIEQAQATLRKMAGPSRRPDTPSLDALSVRPGANIVGLTPQAHQQLTQLDRVLAELKVKGIITSGRDSHAGVRSNHNNGTAVDFVVPGQDMEALAKTLQERGFHVQFERKGQRNANGSVATGDHLHGNLGQALGLPTAPHVPTAEERRKLQAAQDFAADARIGAIRDEEQRKIAERRQKLEEDLRKARESITDPKTLNATGANLRAEADREIRELQERYRNQRTDRLSQLRLEGMPRNTPDQVLAYDLQAAAAARNKASRDGKAANAGVLPEGEREAIQRAYFNAVKTAWLRHNGELANLQAQALATEEDAERQRIGRIKQLREAERDVARQEAEGAGPGALQRFLEERRSSLQQSLDLFSTAPADTEQPETDAQRQERELRILALRKELAGVTAELQSLGRDDQERAEAVAAAERDRLDTLRQIRQEVEDATRSLAQQRAADQGPSALQDYLEQELAQVQSELRGLDRGIADEADPEERAEGQRVLLRLQEREATLKRQLRDVNGELARSERELREARGMDDGFGSGFMKALEEQRTVRRAELESGARNAERRGPRALRPALGNLRDDIRREIQERELELFNAESGGEGDPLQLRLKLVGLKDMELDLTDRLERLRPRWQRFWRELGQDTAEGLKGALAGSIEDALMGRFSASRLLTDLRGVVARGLATAATEGISSMVGRLFRGGKGKDDAGGTEGAEQGLSRVETSSIRAADALERLALSASGLGANGPLGGIAGQVPGGPDSEATGDVPSGDGPGNAATGLKGVAGKIQQNGAGIAMALAGIIGVFNQGKNKLLTVITSVIQLLGSIPMGGGGGTVLSGIFGGISKAFGFDSPLQDSQARELGFQATFGTSRAQVGRWGFDFGTAWGQGLRDAGRGKAQPAPAPVAGREDRSVSVHAVQNYYGPVTVEDQRRGSEDLGWTVQRRLRTLG